MNKNLLTVLAGGFVIALLVAMIVKAGLSGQDQDNTQILVAARNLSVGYDLKPADVRWQNWPKESITPGMIVRKDDKQPVTEVAKGQLRRDLGNGEPVVDGALVRTGRGNILAAALEPGMRAVAIRVKAESMVGGFIAPDDRVDVIMTYAVKAEEMDNPEIKAQVRKYAAETILENVRVLAIDQQARRDDDKAKVGRTVTLEVDTSGAERLNLAETMAEGGLTLALRAIGDDTIMSKTRRNITTDTQVSTVLQEINRLSSGSGGGPSNVVRVYNGEDVQNMVVRAPARADQASKVMP
jgi:pilus assembly protein CpaB